MGSSSSSSMQYPSALAKWTAVALPQFGVPWCMRFVFWTCQKPTLGHQVACVSETAIHHHGEHQWLMKIWRGMIIARQKLLKFTSLSLTFSQLVGVAWSLQDKKDFQWVWWGSRSGCLVGQGLKEYISWKKGVKANWFKLQWV